MLCRQQALMIGGTEEEIGCVVLKYLSSDHSSELTPVAGIPSHESPKSAFFSELSSDFTLIAKEATISAPETILRAIDQVPQSNLIVELIHPMPSSPLEYSSHPSDPSRINSRPN